MLGGLKRAVGALPRLHLLPEHSCAAAALWEAAPLASAAQSGLQARGRAYGTGARPSTSAAPEGLDGDDDSTTVLTLPSSLDVIARLNPELRDVILAHREQEKLGDRTVRAAQQLQSLVSPPQPAQQAAAAAAAGGRGRGASGRVTKSSLMRLRVDELRGQLEGLGADPRGTKEVLALRLLGLLQEGEAAPAAQRVELDEYGDGVVTKRQVSHQRRQAAALAPAAALASSEAGLREAWVTAAVEKSAFSSVISAEEVAALLLEARAEDVAVVDVRATCPFTDWMVLASGRSRRLVASLAGAVHHAVKARCAEVAPGVPPAIEGAQDEPDWLVVDAGDVVAHVFSPEARAEYDLEGLWGGAGGRNVTRLAPRATAQTLDTATA